MMKSRGVRLFGILAILVATFSSGLVLAHQCHDQISTAINQTHSHTDVNLIAAVGGHNSVLDEVCVGIFFLVLLVGRKYLIRQKFNYGQSIMQAVRQGIAFCARPPNLVFALTRSQLGIFRI